MLESVEDKDYFQIVEHILKEKEFKKICNIEHHGTDRLSHSMRVSYYSYKICKLLKLDYNATARAGLLHDFFFSEEERTLKEKFISTFTHPKESLKNSKKYFELSEKEEDIIISHMFPLYKSIPKYAEAWIVSTVDKVVGVYEFSLKFKHKLSYATNLLVFIMLTAIK